MNAPRTDSPPAPRMDGPEAPQVLGWKTCLKNFQASLPSTPSKSSNHTKQVFQASLSSKSSAQALAWKTCLEDLLGRLTRKTCLGDLFGIVARRTWETFLEDLLGLWPNELPSGRPMKGSIRFGPRRNQ